MDSNLALLPFRRISIAATIALAGDRPVAASASTAATNDIPVDFSWAPASPTPGRVVTFTAAVNPPAGVNVKNYDWDLKGDGKFDKHGPDRDLELSGAGPRQCPAPCQGPGKVPWRSGPHSPQVQAAGGGGGGPPPAPSIASFTITSVHACRQSAGALHVDLHRPGRHARGAGLGSQRRRQLRRRRRATALATFPAAGDYVVGLRVTDDSRAGLLRLADVDGPAAGERRHDAEVGATAAESVPGRADRGEDHQARDARAGSTRGHAGRDEDLRPLHRSQLSLQEAGAGGPDERPVARGDHRPRSPSRATAASRRPGARLRHQARGRREIHEAPLPRGQAPQAHRPLHHAGLMGPGRVPGF